MFLLPNLSLAAARCKLCGAPLNKARQNSQLFTIFGFGTALAVQRNANFPFLRTRPFFGADFSSQRSHKTTLKTQHFDAFRAIPSRQNCLMSTCLRCIPSVRSHLFVYHICDLQILGSNSQYNRKLDSKLDSINYVYSTINIYMFKVQWKNKPITLHKLRGYVFFPSQRAMVKTTRYQGRFLSFV